jgi:hypothetical protein
LIVGLSICNHEFLSAYINFKKLQFYRRDNAKAEVLARKLANTKTGIDFCIKDANLFGGTTRGWSLQALHYADNQEYIKDKLIEIINDNSGLPKNIFAYYHLWEITHEKQYLVELYKLLAKGDAGKSYYLIQQGRNILASEFENTEETKKLFNKSPDQDLDLSVQDFEIYCDNHLKID